MLLIYNAHPGSNIVDVYNDVKTIMSSPTPSLENLSLSFNKRNSLLINNIPRDTELLNGVGTAESCVMERLISTPNTPLNCMAVSNGSYTLMPVTGTNYVLRTTDHIEWYMVPLPETLLLASSGVIYNNLAWISAWGIWIMTAPGGPMTWVLISTDGEKWTRVDIGGPAPATTYWNDITFGQSAATSSDPTSTNCVVITSLMQTHTVVVGTKVGANYVFTFVQLFDRVDYWSKAMMITKWAWAFHAGTPYNAVTVPTGSVAATHTYAYRVANIAGATPTKQGFLNNSTFGNTAANITLGISAQGVNNTVWMAAHPTVTGVSGSGRSSPSSQAIIFRFTELDGSTAWVSLGGSSWQYGAYVPVFNPTNGVMLFCGSANAAVANAAHNSHSLIVAVSRDNASLTLLVNSSSTYTPTTGATTGNFWFLQPVFCPDFGSNGLFVLCCPRPAGTNRQMTFVLVTGDGFYNGFVTVPWHTNTNPGSTESQGNGIYNPVTKTVYFFLPTHNVVFFSQNGTTWDFRELTEPLNTFMAKSSYIQQMAAIDGTLIVTPWTGATFAVLKQTYNTLPMRSLASDGATYKYFLLHFGRSRIRLAAFEKIFTDSNLNQCYGGFFNSLAQRTDNAGYRITILVNQYYFYIQTTLGNDLGAGAGIFEISRDDGWTASPTGFPFWGICFPGFDTTNRLYMPRIRLALAVNGVGVDSFLQSIVNQPFTANAMDAVGQSVPPAVDIRFSCWPLINPLSTIHVLGGVVQGGVKQLHQSYGASGDVVVSGTTNYYIANGGSNFTQLRLALPLG